MMVWIDYGTTKKKSTVNKVNGLFGCMDYGQMHACGDKDENDVCMCSNHHTRLQIHMMSLFIGYT